MKFTITFLSLFFVVIQGATAQQKVTGTVLDASDSTALPGAIVACLIKDKVESSTVVGENGGFTIKMPKEGGMVRISYLGYQPYTVAIGQESGNKMNLGTIYLNKATEEIKGVVVSASNYKVDRQIVVPGESKVKGSTDMFTLLAGMNLRGLTVDRVNHTATINGGKPQWKVNGIPKTVADVRNISPKDILRIEYSDAPTTRYMAGDYSGVINIILKQRTEGLKVGVNATSAFTTGFVDGGISASYHKGPSNFSLDYTLSLRNYRKWKKNIESAYYSPTDTVYRNFKGRDGRMGYTDNNLNLNYTYNPNKTLQVSATLYNSFGFQHNRPHFVYGDGVERNVYSSYLGYTPSLDVYIGKTFSRGDKLEANIVGTLGMKGRSLYDLTDLRGGKVVDSYSSPANSKRRSVIADFFYSHPTSTMKWGIGLYNRLGRTTNDYYVPTAYRDLLDENLSYLYTELKGDLWHALQYNVGTGLKHNYMDNRKKTVHYWFNQSFLTLGYSPAKSLYLSYNLQYYPTLPQLYTMTEVAQHIDDLTLIKGNANIKAASNLLNRFTARYSSGLFSLSFTAGYLRICSPIFLTTGYDAEAKSFLQSYNNGRDNSTLSFNLRPSFNDLWGFLNIAGQVGLNRYWANTNDYSHTLTNVYWGIDVQAYYKDWSLSYSYSHPERTLYNETIERGERGSFLTLAYNHDNYSLWCNVYWLFSRQGSDYYSENHSRYNPSKTWVTIRDNANMVSLGFSMNLNVGKTFEKNRRSLQNSDSKQQILRAQ